MGNKIFYTTLTMLFLLQQNIFAINMKKNYKIPKETLSSFFAPINNNSNIVTIYSKSKRKTPYLEHDIIFVKEDLNNLGRYRWTKKYNSYINTKDKEILFFQRNKRYLVSYLQNTKNTHLNKDLESINKNKLSKKELKKIFKIYTNTKLNHKKKLFYSKFIKSLKKDNLLHLKSGEYFLVIDKNLQKSYIFQFNKNGLPLEYIGGDKISTGNSSLNTRNSRFIDTPIGIIDRNKYKKGDWRADKTNFSEYGEKGNKVFYLGKYILPIEHNSKIKRLVHLAIHSTNPIDKQLLGHKASKGCIRISDNFNKILKRSALIDGKNGKYVIILDSKLSIDENIKRVKEFFKYKTSNKKYAMK